MNKKDYSTPDLQIEIVDCASVLTTSGGVPETDNFGEWQWGERL